MSDKPRNSFNAETFQFKTKQKQKPKKKNPTCVLRHYLFSETLYIKNMQRKIKMKESPKNKLAINFVCALEPLTNKQAQ